MAAEFSEEDFCLRGSCEDLISDPCLKRIAVWRRDVGMPKKEKRLKEKEQKSKKDRYKGVEWRMQDLGRHQPLGLWGGVQLSASLAQACKRGLNRVK